MDRVTVVTFMLPDLSSVTTTVCEGGDQTLSQVWDCVKDHAQTRGLKELIHLDSRVSYPPNATLGSVKETMLIFRLTFER